MRSPRWIHQAALGLLLTGLIGCAHGPEGPEPEPLATSRLRFVYLTDHPQSVHLAFDGDVIKDSLTASWISARVGVYSGTHSAVLVKDTEPPLVQWQGSFTLTPDRDHTCYIVWYDQGTDGQCFIDSAAQRADMAVARLVNLHASDSVWAVSDLNGSLREIGVAYPRSAIGYAQVWTETGAVLHASTRSLPHLLTDILALPVTDRAYSLVVYAPPTHSDSAHAFQSWLIEDYPSNRILP